MSDDQESGDGNKESVGPRLLSKSSVCRLLDNVTARHVENLVNSGQMPGPVYLGRSPRWKLIDLLKWIDRNCPVVDPGKLAQWKADKKAGNA